MVDVGYDVSQLLGTSVCRLDSLRMKQLQEPKIYRAIDAMGELSARAMMISKPLTSCERIVENPDHALYVMFEPDEHDPNNCRLLGLLKVGHKTLFFYDKTMKTYHGRVLCVLDFYVHFKRQRQGIGKQLFDFMLQSEHMQPGQMALDNPTVTLLAFINKNYGLGDPVWQNTNFVVFNAFFQQCAGEDEKAVDGWQRENTPKELGAGTTPTRWLKSLGKDTQSKEAKSMSSAWGADLSTEGTMANRSQQAKARKAHILGSQPLW